MIQRSLFFGIVLFVSTGQSIGDINEKRLFESILTNYSIHVRPSDPKHITRPIDVQVSLRLLQIFELEEKSQILKSSVIVLQRWKDQRLCWNSSTFGNVSSLLFKPTEIWTPDIVVINNAVPEYSGKPVGLSAPVHVSHTGDAIWYSEIIIKSYCKMKVKYFPFDEQFCTIKLASWSYNETEVKLVKAENVTNARMNYSENSAWTIDDVHFNHETMSLTYQSPRTPKTVLEYTFHLQRKSFYYFVYLFAPCLLTSILIIMIFILPPECGERMVVGITTMLALTVFFLLAAKNIPETSEDIPLMGRYYSVTLVEMAIAMVCSAVVLRFHYSSSKMPCWIRVYILGYLARLVRINTPYNKKAVTKKGEALRKVSRRESRVHYKPPDGEKSGLVLLAEKLIDDAVVDMKQSEWKLAAKVINRFFLLLYVSVTIITLIGIFIQTPGFIIPKAKLHQSH